MNTNASTLTTKTTVSHTAYEGTRIRAGVRSGARRETAIAKHTIVRTPERPTRSATIQTPNVVMNWKMIAVGTSVILFVRARTSRASTGPATRLPATASRNAGATARIENALAATAPTASR